jgi:hypothetical protein
MSALEEAFVASLEHLRLHLADRVEGDADDDQHRGAAERITRSLGRTPQAGAAPRRYA